MSAFKFSIERPIPIVATNPLSSTTPFLGLWAQQVHSPLLKRLRPKYFLQFFLKLLLRWGGAHQRGHFWSFFPCPLQQSQKSLRKLTRPSFLLELLVLTKFRLAELRILTLYSRPNEVFSSLCFLQFGESLGTASNKQLDLMMNSGKLRITTHLWL